MTIHGQGYKPTFLRCIEEGYDAMCDHLNGNLEYLENPYHEDDYRYEHDAWSKGANWYMVEVH